MNFSGLINLCEKHRNDRLIAIAEKAEVFCDVSSVRELNSTFLEQIEHFFVSYNQVEGKQFKPLKRSGPTAAMMLIKAGQRSYSSPATQIKNS